MVIPNRIALDHTDASNAARTMTPPPVQKKRETPSRDVTGGGGGAAGVSAPGADWRGALNEVYISDVENVAREHYRVTHLYMSGVFLHISLLSPPEMVPLHKKIIPEKVYCNRTPGCCPGLKV